MGAFPAAESPGAAPDFPPAPCGLAGAALAGSTFAPKKKLLTVERDDGENLKILPCPNLRNEFIIMNFNKISIKK
jgi:hypothetical protein